MILKAVILGTFKKHTLPENKSNRISDSSVLAGRTRGQGSAVHFLLFKSSRISHCWIGLMNVNEYDQVMSMSDSDPVFLLVQHWALMR